MSRDRPIFRPGTLTEALAAGLLRGLSWVLRPAKLDRPPLHGLSSHLLRDIGLASRSTGDDGEEPWKRLK